MISTTDQQTLRNCFATGSQALTTEAARDKQMSIPSTVKPDAGQETEELLDLFGKPRPVPLKEDCLPPILREYLDLTRGCTDAKPGMLITAWLPFAAVNLGNRVYMLNKHTRIYPNIWSCLIGRSGVSRKTTSLQFAGYTTRPYERLLDELPGPEFEHKTLLMNGITLSKLFSYLADNPCRLFVHNEIGGWLAEMNKSYNASYKQTVTELYDGVDRTITNRERLERIRKPALSIAAATTEGWLYKNVGDSADQLSGFIQRFIYYNAGEIGIEDIDLNLGSEFDLADRLEAFENRCFRAWRAIPDSNQLRLSEDAKDYRNDAYAKLYARVFKRDNDALLSYFTRIYDGYWFKFCMLDTMAENADRLKIALDYNQVGEFFEDELRVDGPTAARAMELCNFYLRNTMPLMNLLADQDKMAPERRLVDLIVHKYGGRASHSRLMNSSHMGKREFATSIETLIEREAMQVQTYQLSRNRSGRMYVIHPAILDSWKPNRQNPN